MIKTLADDAGGISYKIMKISKGILICLPIFIILMPSIVPVDAASNTSHWKIITRDWEINLSFLPKEIKDIMNNQGWSMECVEIPAIKLWSNHKNFLVLRGVSCVTGQSISMEILLPKNDFTDYPVYISFYCVSARNVFDKVLFYQHSGVVYYKTDNVTVLPYIASGINKFKLMWHNEVPDKNCSNGTIVSYGHFYNLLSQQMILWSSVSYDEFGIQNETGGVK